MKTLALSAICKNEEKHIERWLNTFLPLVDHIYLTDTGSTDETVALAKVAGKNKLTIKTFDWVNDFAAARNFAQKDIKEDYIFWVDLDDSIRNPEAFLEWKNRMMHTADLWLSNYNYALHQDGVPACAFARERVFKNNGKFYWNSFVHEGIDTPDQKAVSIQFASSWAIDHLRTPEDLAKDKGRNLRIFEEKLKEGVTFDARMTYYYGKELFEAGKSDEALKYLLKANTFKEMALHDRVLAIQYAVYILIQKNEYMQAINMAQSGLLLQPQRAEFFVLIADAFIKQNRVKDALPFYEAAKACEPLPEKGFQGFIFQNKSAYTDYPRNQIARVYANEGNYSRARKEAFESYSLYKSEESKALVEACEKVIEASTKYKTAEACKDIVFTCPGGLYEWDSKIYKEKGIGGSETACVEVAKWAKRITGKRVLVFNPRKEPFIDEDGVEYAQFDQMHEYFAKWKPALHVAWRHSMKITDAKTLVWSHDIFTPGAEKVENYDKFLALSNFHKDFVKTLTQLPDEKIYVFRNGIDPLKFEKPVDPELKNPNKVIYCSSPDRGLDRVIDICEIARAKNPEIELHVFYGLDNLYKMGKQADADRFKALMDKPWIKYHGNLAQKDLIAHYRDASVWLYPTNFMETFCITALEVGLCGVYPLVRNYGALPETVSHFPCEVVDRDADSFEDKIYWAERLCNTIEKKLWHNIDQARHSEILGHLAWEQVGRELIEEFLDDDSHKSI